MTLVRLTQHFFSMAWSFGVNHIYYETMPPRDQTAHTSFYSLSQNVLAFISMSIGTWFISFMGDRSVKLLGQQLTSVPLLMLITVCLLVVFVGIVFAFRKKLEAPRADTDEAKASVQ